MIIILRKGQARVYGASNGGVTVTNWFGTGIDGDMVVKSGETKTLDVIKDSGQIILNLENLTIENGGVLKPSNRCNGMILLVRGDFILNGTISVDKCAPCLNDDEEYCKSLPWVRMLNLTGGSGGNGGNGYTKTSVNGPPSTSVYERTTGGGGGEGFWCGGGSGGGGGASGFYYQSTQDSDADGSGRYNHYAVANGSSGARAPSSVGLPYTNPSTSYKSSGAYGTGGNTNGSAKGGAAPGGSGATWDTWVGWATYGGGYHYQTGSQTAGNAGDAYGGGAVWIYVKGNVVIGSTGAITANGGNGADAVYIDYSSGAGGGGGGGIIAIVYGGSITNQGSLKANGGKGGAKAGSGSYTDAACAGSSGSVGTVVVKPLQEVFDSVTA